ncbi:uncharacterized protein LOC124855307 [Scomber scombrus]|uniref:Uncharacterized protein LOC124855307 n=1 Tax=Scomber scombrus TaxID=13677 RepID=A0AAV1QJL5_SCOSC
MISVLIIFTVSLLCTAGGQHINQTWRLMVEMGHSAEMDCNHSLGGTYFHMYWFQQLPGESMKHIVYTVPFSKQHGFGNFSQEKFSATKPDFETGSFTVKNVQPEDNDCPVTCVQSVSQSGDKEEDIMITNINSVTLLLLSLSCCSLNAQVLQLPSSILESPHNSATITCNHSISSYYVILWYQQSTSDSGLKLIGYISYTNPTVEDPFKQHFNVTGDGSTKSQLHVVKLRESEDSSMYYCAASRHSDTVTFWPLQKPSIIYLH